MSDGTDRPDPRRAGAQMRWPPPGLERLQGDMGEIGLRALLAGGLLVLPLLFVIARDQGLATLGPFADAWWVTILLATVGLAFSIDAMVRSARMASRFAQALSRGYDLTTVAQVATDTNRDMGFLLLGARHFELMDERERGAMATIRIFHGILYALGGLWLSVGLGVGLLAASRGALTPTGLTVFTIMPAGIAYAVALVAKLVHDARIRRARRAFFQQPWTEDLAGGEVEQWKATAATLALAEADEPDTPPSTIAILKRAWIPVALVAAISALPVMTLVPTSAVGPILTAVTVPGANTTLERAARVEGMRAYSVAPDPSVSPQEAGQLLHDLSYVGREYDARPGEQRPSREVTQPWIEEEGEDNPLGIDPFQWGDSLLAHVAMGTTGAQRAYLAQIASHPSRPDFSRLATAAEIDIASARWDNPFPPEINLATLPLPRYRELRYASRVHIAAAAYAFVEGRNDEAARLLSEVVAVGFLLGDQGPTLLDNFVGFTFVEAGSRALEDLYRNTDPEAHEALLQFRDVADRAASRGTIARARGAETWVRSLPLMVMDSTTLRGLRWEYFTGVATLTPCLNLHRMVFGPDAEYEEFVQAAHDNLVRWPSEEGLFDLSRRGWLGTLESEGETMLGRLLSVSMRQTDGACGDIVRRVETARELF